LQTLRQAVELAGQRDLTELEKQGKGNDEQGSDIDLTLYGKDLTTAQLGDIAEALDDLLLPARSTSPFLLTSSRPYREGRAMVLQKTHRQLTKGLAHPLWYLTAGTAVFIVNSDSQYEGCMAAKKFPTALRQDQIVEAAFQMMCDNPTRPLHIKDIAQRLGMAPSALYRHFRNRDAVMSAVLELIRSKLFRNVEAVRQTSDDAVERLWELLSRHIRLIKERHGIPKIFFSDELWGQNEERRRKMFRIVTGYLAEIEDIVREGQRNGRIRADIAPKAAAKMFFGMVQPAALLWHMSGGQFDIDEHIAVTWPLFAQVLA
jgi:AcrR family transcriptional regulator